MSTNPPNLRPDLAPAARITDAPRSGQPTIGMVSLGCPKALVDSERILTRLRAEGYGISPDYAGADVDSLALSEGDQVDVIDDSDASRWLCRQHDDVMTQG